VPGVERSGVDRAAAAAPVPVEVPQVGADRLRTAVEQLLGKVEAVEVLVPELAALVGREREPSGARVHRVAEHQRRDPLRRLAGELDRDGRAEIVTDQYRRPDAQRVEHRADHPGLRRAPVLGSGQVGPGGTAEAAQVERDHVGGGLQHGAQPAVVVPIPRPTVQAHHRPPPTAAGVVHPVALVVGHLAVTPRTGLGGQLGAGHARLVGRKRKVLGSPAATARRCSAAFVRS
jgi:hypothetical protein